MMAGKDPFEDFEDRMEKFLAAREKRQAEAKDPRARFEGLMNRFEGILDALEEGREKPERKRSSSPADEGKGGDIFSELFGKRE